MKKKSLSTGHFLESKKQARQNQIFLTDESHSQSAMGEEERKSDEAAAAYRFQKMSCTKKFHSLLIIKSKRVNYGN